MDVAATVANLGFPIALAIYLLQREAKTNERMLSILERAVATMERSNKIAEELTMLINKAKA